MAEYIERIELIEEMKRNSLKMFNSYYKGYVEAIKDVADFKKADVQPVKHGKWNHGKCTNCQKSLEDLLEGDFYYDCDELHYCPNCGADMRGDTNG